ncbi:transposase [Bdellovibrio sp. HCB2-146]|uniref:transposase n=1 Tax=Bdellovibrio sp. HCB2-146 TaxID=3394362 RepID=UPI0039BD52B4
MGRKQFICNTELPYHITARCINRDWFSEDLEDVWSIMTMHLTFISFAFNIRVHAFVLMSNHYHLIVHAPEGNLSEAMRFFMSESGRDLRRLSKRINCTYGTRFHRSLLSSPQYYLHAYKYLYHNPIAAGICERVEDYPYSALPGLMGNARMDVPIYDDFNWSTFHSRVLTLDWLNRKPNELQWEIVRRSLRKSTFKLPKQNKKPNSLEFHRL